MYLEYCISYSYSIIFHIQEYDQPHESQTNKEIMETITRKGLNGGDDDDCDYPYEDSPKADDHTIGNRNSILPSSTLSNHHINQTPMHDNSEFQALLQNRNQLNAASKFSLFLKFPTLLIAMMNVNHLLIY